MFLCYRREDTAGRAGRLRDGLATRLGAAHVFQDVDSIAPGDDFDIALRTAISEADAVIAAIGTNWAASLPDGTRRLDQPDDYVRREITTALSMQKPVVPVLVGGAHLPAHVELPDDLRPLLSRQAFTIRDERWNDDVDGLVARLQGDSPGAVLPDRRRWPAALTLGVVLTVLGALVLPRVLGNEDESSGSTEPPSCGPPAANSALTPLAASPVVTVNEISSGVNQQVRFTALAAWAEQRQGVWQRVRRPRTSQRDFAERRPRHRQLALRPRRSQRAGCRRRRAGRPDMFRNFVRGSGVASGSAGRRADRVQLDARSSQRGDSVDGLLVSDRAGSRPAALTSTNRVG